MSLSSKARTPRARPSRSGLDLGATCHVTTTKSRQHFCSRFAPATNGAYLFKEVKEGLGMKLSSSGVQVRGLDRLESEPASGQSNQRH